MPQFSQSSSATPAASTAEGDTNNAETAAAEQAAAAAASEAATASAATTGDPATNPPATEGATTTTEPEVDEITLDGEPIVDEEEAQFAAAEPWVKELRQKFRDTSRRLRELEGKSAPSTTGAAPAAKKELGPEPKIEDFDFDAAKFSAALRTWHAEKAAIEAEESAARQTKEAEKRAWDARVQQYRDAATKLRVPDFADAEAAATADLSIMQQGILVQGCDAPEVVMYAIGRSPKRRAQLAAIQDPVKFAFAIAKLEQQLKVAPKSKTTTKPETAPRQGGGAAVLPATTDKKLEELRAEAMRTGDTSKLNAYKRDLRRKAA